MTEKLIENEWMNYFYFDNNPADYSFIYIF